MFGVQICGSYPDTVARTVELIEQECTVDFIDINMGCPIDIVVNKGAGSALLTKPMRMKGIVQAASGTVDIPMTIKVNFMPTLYNCEQYDLLNDGMLVMFNALAAPCETFVYFFNSRMRTFL